MRREPSCAFSVGGLSSELQKELQDMGKKTYRVKQGDDFFKISKKLYGDASYARALMRRNPGFDHVGLR
jgi:hypothetical protein